MTGKLGVARHSGYRFLRLIEYLQEITSLVIKVFYQVYHTLGYGFLENVYENAMLIELRKQGLTAKSMFGA